MMLAHILEPLRLSGVFLSEWKVNPPWSLYGVDEKCALIHYMVKGKAFITINNYESFLLSEGDIAIFPQGSSHVIADSLNTPPKNIDSLLPDRNVGMFKTFDITDDENHDYMLCAGLHYDSEEVLPLCRLLPKILIIRYEQIQCEPLLKQTLAGLLYELEKQKSGRELVLLRGLELIYVLSLRVALHAIDSLENLSRILSSPKICRSLLAIYNQYSKPWTLELLAKESAMSRSSFAKLFKLLIGESPMQHLMKQRLYKACLLLRDNNKSIDIIARKVGYESSVGLHLAFKKEFNKTPGMFRNKK